MTESTYQPPAHRIALIGNAWDAVDETASQPVEQDVAAPEDDEAEADDAPKSKRGKASA